MPHLTPVALPAARLRTVTLADLAAIAASQGCALRLYFEPGHPIAPLDPVHLPAVTRLAEAFREAS